MPAIFVDPDTGFAYPGAPLVPFPAAPSSADLQAALKPMILSASGWRKVFGQHDEDPSPSLTDVDRVLALGMAEAFASFLGSTPGGRIAVGLDARFTGPAIADAMIRVLLARGFGVDYLGIVAAPEIMAWVQTGGVHAGFVYVSASHNPVGHNGIKFGLGNGGVVGGAPAADLIAGFRSSISGEAARTWIADAEKTPASTMEAVLGAMPTHRRAAAQAYGRLTDEIFTGSGDPRVQADRKAALVDLVGRRLGVVAELNGSARGLSIDRPWLADLGIAVSALNDRPRQFVHRIVPEGSSLDLCRQELDRVHRQDPRFDLGYVPDCDGDRGNIVFYDPSLPGARSLEAQEVFALCVLAELAGLDYYGELQGPVAVVANDPTSFRVDAIAAAFGAQVFRVEVGEANVVQRARTLRAEGWTVRILGEGSNGGNITFPGSVRDPLSTLGSLIKLTSLRSVAGRPGLFERWCLRSGQPEAYREDYTLADIVATIPAWTTTSTSEDRAMLQIRTTDHAALKARFEALWPGAWASKEPQLSPWGLCSWEEVNYEGTTEKPGLGPAFRSGRQTGGLKLVFRDDRGELSGCLWMRGSGTEPVFRILAEVRGPAPDAERELLRWFTDLVRQADAP